MNAAKCDCLNFCGDDPRLMRGRCDRCEGWKNAQFQEQQFYDQLPELAYNAYCQQTGWKSAVTGADLPIFANTPDSVRQAWKAAAYALAHAVGYRRQYPPL